MSADNFDDFDFGAPLSVEHVRAWREQASAALDQHTSSLKELIRSLEEHVWRAEENASESQPEPKQEAQQPVGSEPSLSMLTQALERRYGKAISRPNAAR